MVGIDMKILESAASMLRVVAHPVRIQLINILVSETKLSVTELQQKLGITQSMTSQHLSALRRVGVVDYEKEGNVSRYYLKNKNVLKLLECVERCARSK